MKNGSQSSRSASTPGAPPAELGPIGTGADPGRHGQAEARGGPLQVVVGQADGVPTIAVGRQPLDRTTEPRRSGDRRILDGDELQVVVAERHDPVDGAPRRMPATGDRPEAVIPQQPLGGGVEVADRQHHVVDALHGGERATRTRNRISAPRVPSR
jgi:hypothetical protein